MDKVRLQIISPYKVVFDGECTMIEYNTTEGYVGVLPGHVAMTQIIAPGRLTIYEEKPTYAALMSGISTIMPDSISLLAEIVELKDEIDVERAKASRERALHRIENKEPDTDLVRAEEALHRANVRLEVAEL